MVKIGLVVPVFKNFVGFAEMMQSVDMSVQPIVIANWQHNVGVSAGWNAGIKRAIDDGCDLALVVNDDIIFERGTIAKLRASVWGHRADLVTPVNTRDGQGLTTHVEHIPNPDFACFMIEPERFVEKFGWFDTAFTPAYFEDNDMHYRIKIQNGSAFARSDAGFFHRGSVTQNWGGIRVVSNEMFRRNEEYYARKWGGRPGSEKYTTPFGQQ